MIKIILLVGPSQQRFALVSLALTLVLSQAQGQTFRQFEVAAAVQLAKETNIITSNNKPTVGQEVFLYTNLARTQPLYLGLGLRFGGSVERPGGPPINKIRHRYTITSLAGRYDLRAKWLTISPRLELGLLIDVDQYFISDSGHRQHVDTDPSDGFNNPLVITGLEIAHSFNPTTRPLTLGLSSYLTANGIGKETLSPIRLWGVGFFARVRLLGRSAGE